MNTVIQLNINLIKERFSNGLIKLINIDDFKYVEDAIQKAYKVTENIFRGIGDGFIYVLAKDVDENIENQIICIANEYELSNTDVFNGILIMPGHDSITLLNMDTLEHKQFFHR